MSKNQYRNSLKSSWLMRIILGSVTVAAIFATFVVLRNRQVKQGDRISAAEKAIIQLDKEVDMWESRIEGQLAHAELKSRLEWVESDLGEISASRILVLSPQDEVPALPKVALSQ